MHRPFRLLALAVIVALVGAACGDDEKGVSIDDPWARASAMTQNAGAVYFTVRGGTDGDTLVGASVSAEVAAQAQLHETTMDDEGMMAMSMVARVPVPAGGELAFEPGGFHVMLMDLVAPLQDGSTFEVTLAFERAGEQTVVVEVRDE